MTIQTKKTQKKTQVIFHKISIWWTAILSNESSNWHCNVELTASDPLASVNSFINVSATALIVSLAARLRKRQQCPEIINVVDDYPG